MNNKKIYSVLVGVLVLAAAVGLAKTQANSKKNSQPRPNSYNMPALNSTTTPSSTTDGVKNNNTVKNSPASSSPSDQTPAVKTYTLDEIKQHNNQNDCWSTINGVVYDFTPWVSKHPGGSRAIISICGRDGSEDFNDQHSGDGRVAKVMATFKIGNLK